MNQSSRRRRGALGVLCLALCASTLSAQAADTTRSSKTLFTAGDAALGTGFAGLTVAMFPLDKSLPGAYVIGPALYVIGRYGHRPHLRSRKRRAGRPR